jgi:hypothetical protein
MGPAGCLKMLASRKNEDFFNLLLLGHSCDFQIFKNSVASMLLSVRQGENNGNSLTG